MKHARKVKIMRRLRTADERKESVPMYDSLNWRKRKWQIMQRVYRQNLLKRRAIDIKRERKLKEALNV